MLNGNKRKNIKEKASKTLEAIGYNTEMRSKPNIVGMANCFGFAVSESTKLDDRILGSLYVSEGGKKKLITINRNYPYYNKRETIAYLLAFYLLKYEEGIEIKINKSLATIDEEVEYLADSLLMPYDGFRTNFLSAERIYGENKDVFLKDKYCVTLSSIWRRVEDIKGGKK